MDERTKQAFDFASECVKQLLALSTGIVALTVTFSKDIAHPRFGGVALLSCSWGFYVLSIGAGIASLMNMTGELSPKLKQRAESDPSIWARGIVIWTTAQVILFLLATLGIITFAALAVACPAP